MRATDLSAQVHAPLRPLPTSLLLQDGAAIASGPASVRQDTGARAALGPAALSLAVPGAGQLLLDRHRGWAYLALEAVGWVVYANRRSEGARYRSRYRDLAWDVARVWEGPRVDGDFAYYERLSVWTRSGRFDTDPDASGLQPETDPTTFNGSIWDRARAIYSVVPGQDPTTPGYQAALAYYDRNAYGEAFLWSWADEPEARNRFSGWIRESDERFREATVSLGLLFANHLIAAADAWVTARGVTAALAPASQGDGSGVQILVRWEHR